MDCPKCKSHMEKGMMSDDGQHWIKEKGFVGNLNKTFSFGLNRIFAWMCPNCGKVELQGEMK